MRIPGVHSILRRIAPVLKRNPDRFLNDVSGVIHVGANTGQERDLYRSLGLHVIWVEPIPEVFRKLQQNIEGYPNQCALQGLVTDRDGQEYEFHVANNGGASSSILDLKDHKEIWPAVTYTTSISLRSMTLTSLLQNEKVDLSKYQALVMDTQGSELLVLKGSVPILSNFKYIKTEVPDFESYAGCCQLEDIDLFMIQNGYAELSRNQFAKRAQGGSYFDIVYSQKAG